MNKKRLDFSKSDVDMRDPANARLAQAAKRGDKAFNEELDRQVQEAEKWLSKKPEVKVLPRRKPLWVSIKIAMNAMDFHPID